MSDMFPGMFISTLTDNVSDFFSEAFNFVSDKGSDIINNFESAFTTEGMSELSKGFISPGAGKGSSIQERSAARAKAATAGLSSGGFSSPRGRYDSGNTQYLPSVDPKQMHREWMSRLSTFAGVYSDTYTPTPTSGASQFKVRGDR